MRLSQDELGVALSVSGKTMSSWKIRRTELNMGYVQKLSNYFNASIYQLIYGQTLTIAPRFNDFHFTLMHGEIDLSEDQKQNLLDYYEFIKSKKR